MKSVLISIQPKWCELIASGKKTIEIRKTVPKIAAPFKCYIYETQGATEMPWMDEEGHMIFRGRGMIIGEFVCDFIEPVSANNRYIISKLSCVPLPDLYNYAGAKGLEGLKGWHISDLVIYDEPKPLREYMRCPYPWDCGACDLFDGFYMVCNRKIMPPQSWCYVERGTDNA